MARHKEYYKINEIAKLYDLHPDTLRYYEEQGLLSPARGENGYRLYSIQDICDINIIQNLRSLNMPVSKIGAYMGSRTVDSTLALLDEEVGLIDRRIAALNALRGEVTGRRARLLQSLSMPVGRFELVELPPRPCYTLSEGLTLESDVDYQLKKLAHLHSDILRVIGERQMGATLDEESLTRGVYSRFSQVFFLAQPDETADQTIPGGLYATTVYGGDYTALGDVLPALMGFAGERRLRPVGPPMELYHIDIHDTQMHQQFRTQVQVRVDAAKF